MRFFPYKLIKKDKLEKISEEYATLQTQVVAASDFISEIEKGNLEVQYQNEDVTKGDSDDQLADSLVRLRKQIINASLEEKQRNWGATTRSQFIDILRTKNDNLQELANSIIKNLVKSLSANQGGLYLINDDDLNDVFIQLLACYAYERKKYISQRIEIGQGLVGQTILEKAYTYLRDIPESYLKITSGLGESTPSHLLIVPLQLDEKVFGAIEIASFHPIHEFEIEFVEQLGESIASTIATVKNNQRTRQLLEESQQQAEQMQAQEEAVRQNLEELQATQEEMQRISIEMSEQLRVINATIATIEFDLAGNMKDANENLLQLMGYNKDEILNKHHRLFVLESESKSKEYIDFWKNLALGQSFNGEFKRITKQGELVWIKGMYSPIKNKKGEIIKIVKFAYDITDTIKAKEKAEMLLEETQLQAELMEKKSTELESRMKAVDESGIASVEFDLDGNILSANDNFLKMLDYKLEEVSGKHHSMFIPKAFAKTRSYQLFWEDLNKGNPQHGEYIFIGKNGKKVFIQGSYSIIRDSKGNPKHILKLAADITVTKYAIEEGVQRAEEVQRMMKEIQASEYYLRELLDLTQETVFTSDKDGNIITFNKYFEEDMKKYGIKIEKGFNYLTTLPTQEEVETQKQIIEKVFAGETKQISLFYDVNGREIHLISTYSPVRSIKGEITAMAVYSKDVTELVLAKRKLQ